MRASPDRHTECSSETYAIFSPDLDLSNYGIMGFTGFEYSNEAYRDNTPLDADRHASSSVGRDFTILIVSRLTVTMRFTRSRM